MFEKAFSMKFENSRAVLQFCSIGLASFSIFFLQLAMGCFGLQEVKVGKQDFLWVKDGSDWRKVESLKGVNGVNGKAVGVTGSSTSCTCNCNFKFWFFILLLSCNKLFSELVFPY